MTLQNVGTVGFIIFYILNLIHKSSISFHFKCVKEHSEVTGSELTDSMTKIDKYVSSFLLPLPASQLKYKLNQTLKLTGRKHGTMKTQATTTIMYNQVFLLNLL